MKGKIKKEDFNALRLALFCAMLGAVSSLVFWLFLLAVKGGTALLWEVIPSAVTGTPAIWYPLVLCLTGGLLIGIFRKVFGDYPEEMMDVFGTLKKTGSYPYQKMLVLLIAPLLPLIFGSSVGPEAGMVGIIVALCCWAGENIKYAGKQTSEYSRMGAAVSLSVIFRSPLFGIFEVEEDPAGYDSGNQSENDAGDDAGSILSKPEKILLYCIAAGAAFGSFYLLNQIIKASEGFPVFDRISPGAWDCVLSVLYLACGIVLGLFFEYTERFFEKMGKMIPPVLREMLAGLILGGCACLLPVIRFSGEEQMGVLITDYARYAPLAMIGIAFLKVALTNLCIRLGLKGGHFFPLIFAAVCLGYGLSLLVFPGDGSHATFAAAVSAAGTLGVSMKKPLAVSMLLLICFPANALLWIVPAAAVASFIGQHAGKKDGR